MTQKQPRILIIKLGALGDFILQTGQMRAICKAYPDAHVTLMTNKSLIKIANQMGIFHDYVVDNRTWRPNDWIRIIKTLAFGKYDVIFDIQKQRRTRQKYYFFARLLAPKHFCWAFSIPTGYHAIKVHKFFSGFWGKAEEADFPLQRIKSSLDFCHGPNENFHLLPNKFVLMIPGCSPSHPYKRWPVKSYANLAVKLAEHDISSVILGTTCEKDEIDAICSATPRAVNFCNKTTLLDIPDLARRALVIVGNDTGPTHMAELTDQPTISLFSSKTKNSARCADNVYNFIQDDIADISVQTVFDQIQSIIHNAKKSA